MKKVVKWSSGQVVKWAKVILLIHLFTYSLTYCLYAQKEAKASIETKIALETNLENRLKKVLTEITGTEKIIVIVNVELMSEKKETPSSKKEDEVILPGVSLKENLTEKKVESVMLSALGDDTRTMIKKLSVTIILDKSISSSVIEVVKKVAAGLLGIEPERGDDLIIQQMSFQKNPFYWGSLIYPPNIYWILGILAGIGFALVISLFLFGPFQKFAGDLVAAAVSSASSFKEKSAESSGGFSAANALPELAPAKETKKEQTATGESPLFSFITAENVKELIYLLRTETSKNIASTLNYLSPEISSQVINEILPEKKKEVISFLSKTEELDPSEVEKLETRLKTRIDYLSGGEEKIMRLVSYADETSQAEIFNVLKDKDPELAEKIQKSIIRIDTISTLDIAQIQFVIKQMGTAAFGQILKTLSDEIREKIFSTLPAGAAARIKQEMELGKPFTSQRLEIEKKRILDILRRMKERGMI